MRTRSICLLSTSSIPTPVRISPHMSFLLTGKDVCQNLPLHVKLELTINTGNMVAEHCKNASRLYPSLCINGTKNCITSVWKRKRITRNTSSVRAQLVAPVFTCYHVFNNLGRSNLSNSRVTKCCSRCQLKIKIFSLALLLAMVTCWMRRGKNSDRGWYWPRPTWKLNNF